MRVATEMWCFIFSVLLVPFLPMIPCESAFKVTHNAVFPDFSRCRFGQVISFSSSVLDVLGLFRLICKFDGTDPGS